MGNVSNIRKKPGPPPGTHHAGTFKPGPDPRRYKHDEERRKARLTVEELAKTYTEEAFGKLVDLLDSDSPKVAIEAASQILDRGWGRSVDRVQIAQIDATGATGGAALPLEELRRRAQNLLESDDDVTTGVTLEHDHE